MQGVKKCKYTAVSNSKSKNRLCVEKHTLHKLSSKMKKVRDRKKGCQINSSCLSVKAFLFFFAESRFTRS